MADDGRGEQEPPRAAPHCSAGEASGSGAAAAEVGDPQSPGTVPPSRTSGCGAHPLTGLRRPNRVGRLSQEFRSRALSEHWSLGLPRPPGTLVWVAVITPLLLASRGADGTPAHCGLRETGARVSLSASLRTWRTCFRDALALPSSGAGRWGGTTTSLGPMPTVTTWTRPPSGTTPLCRPRTLKHLQQSRGPGAELAQSAGAVREGPRGRA